MATPLPKRISRARSVAFEVLLAVEDGEYAADELRERARGLDGRDAGLASQIVFGSLRFQSQLDYLIQYYSGRAASKLDVEVRLALRTALFQLRYLERVPPHAVVHETVEIVKHLKRSASGLANAVLRKVNRQPIVWPDEATELSCPAWLLERWRSHFGAETADKIARSFLSPPTPYIRVAPGSPLPEGLDLEPTEVPGCYRVRSSPSFDLRLHDIGSQAIVPLLDLQPNQSYLDLCSAPGNKTRQAMESPLALAVACDISLKRIRSLPSEYLRVVLDGRAELPFSRKFDRIFIDAPCSGTGTIGRNPEIKWRVQETDFSRFGRLQVELLRRAAPLLAPGGKILYATCSLEREENEDVIERFCASEHGMKVEREQWRLPGREEGDGFYAAVLSAGDSGE